MAYKPHARRQITKRVEIEYEGEPCWVEYRPAAVTGAFFERLLEKRGTAANALYVAEVITAWDVLDEDGQMLAPSYEQAMTLEPQFVAAVVNAVVEDMRPGKTSGGGSFVG